MLSASGPPPDIVSELERAPLVDRFARSKKAADSFVVTDKGVVPKLHRNLLAVSLPILLERVVAK
jgi:hypothetical protein